MSCDSFSDAFAEARGNRQELFEWKVINILQEEQMKVTNNIKILGKKRYQNSIKRKTRC